MVRKKIAHVITRLDLGGSADCTLLTVLGLLDDYELTLLHGPTGVPSRYFETLKDRRANIVEIPDLVRNLSPGKDLKAAIRLAVLLRRGGYDLVHTHTSKAGLLGRVAAVLAGVPIIVHTPHGHIFHGYFSKPLSSFFILCERLAAPLSDIIITLTKRGTEDHLDHHIGVRRQYRTIHSGVVIAEYESTLSDEQREEARRNIGLAGNDFVVGFVGRFEAVKDPVGAVTGFNHFAGELEGVKLLMAGSGPLQGDIERLLDELRIADRVRIVERKDSSDLFGLFDCLLIPSRNEGMGRVIVEAMINGLPIIGTKVGGIPELVSDGVNGYLVDPGDYRTIGRCLERLYFDRESRIKMADEGRKRARMFSHDRMVDLHRELYEELFKRLPKS